MNSSQLIPSINMTLPLLRWDSGFQARRLELRLCESGRWRRGTWAAFPEKTEPARLRGSLEIKDSNKFAFTFRKSHVNQMTEPPTKALTWIDPGLSKLWLRGYDGHRRAVNCWPLGGQMRHSLIGKRPHMALVRRRRKNARGRARQNGAGGYK